MALFTKIGLSRRFAISGKALAPVAPIPTGRGEQLPKTLRFPELPVVRRMEAGILIEWSPVWGWTFGAILTAFARMVSEHEEWNIDARMIGRAVFASGFRQSSRMPQLDVRMPATQNIINEVYDRIGETRKDTYVLDLINAVVGQRLAEDKKRRRVIEECERLLGISE